MKLFNTIFILAFVINVTYVFSQNQQAINKEKPDTTAIGPEDDDELEPVQVDISNATNEYFKITKDNNYDVPAYNQYFFWDTLDVHPYQSKMNKFTETRILKLVDSNSVFTIPIKGPVNSNFGWRKWKHHYGIDLGLKKGDTIVTAFDGMVRVVRKSKSYGNVIVIRDNNGLETLYAHLSKALVKTNQEVKSGEYIGLGGSTGHSTGPHLHFELRYLGGPINPNEIINFNNFSLLKDTLVVDHCLFDYLNDVQKTRYYTIKNGDSLGKIAKRNGVSIFRLCKLNGIKRNTLLKIGRKLRYN